jgi:hypothetical protein
MLFYHPSPSPRTVLQSCRADVAAAPPLVSQGADAGRKAELKAKNAAALAKRRESLKELKVTESQMELPAGWIRVESRSRPGPPFRPSLIDRRDCVREYGHWRTPSLVSQRAGGC